MYLTAGQFKGRKIEVPKNVQPTLSKVRESVFNILLQYDLSGNKFLNMFLFLNIIGECGRYDKSSSLLLMFLIFIDKTCS